MIISGKKFLATLDEPIMAPTGLLYLCVWGTFQLHEYSETFPFPVKGHVNYYYHIGWPSIIEGVIIVGGCRVRKAVQMDTPPPIMLTNKVMAMGGDGIPFPLYYPNYFNADQYCEEHKT